MADLLKLAREPRLFTALLCGIIAYRHMTPEMLDFYLNYLLYAPNNYRVVEVLVLWLHYQQPIALTTLLVVVFAVSVFALFSLVKPTAETVLMMGLLASWPSVLSAVQWPMLALIAHDSKRFYWLTLPLVFVKEYAAVVAVVFLFFCSYLRYDRLLLIGSCIILVVLVFLLTGGAYMPGTAGMFTLTYWPTQFLLHPILVALPILYMLMLVRLRPNIPFAVLALSPILLFGLPWEPQLWAPVIVMTAAQQRYEKSSKEG